MKLNRLLLIGIGLPFVMVATLKAQKRTDGQVISWSQIGDTLSLKLEGNQRILISGPTFNDLPRQADSLVNLFTADYQKGIAEDAQLASSREVHYIIHPSGKRRLKYSNGADEEFNLNRELQKLNMNLAAYSYIIYFNGCIISIYLDDPSKLSSIGTIRLNQAIASALENKSLIKRNNLIETEYVADGIWKTDPIHRRPFKYSLELGANFGVLVFPNHFGPEYGMSIFYKYRNRLNQPVNAIGYSFDLISVKDFKDVKDYGTMKNLSSNVWHKLSFIHKIGDNALGIHYGYLYDGTHQTFVLNGLTVGFSLHVKHISYCFDLVTAQYNGHPFPAPCFGIKVGY